MCRMCHRLATARYVCATMERARSVYSGWRSCIGNRRGDTAIEMERRDAVLGDEATFSQFDRDLYMLREIRLFCGL